VGLKAGCYDTQPWPNHRKNQKAATIKPPIFMQQHEKLLEEIEANDFNSYCCQTGLRLGFGT
jgi:hypothetical protein